ncbi:hypothetical protein Lfu02_46450 [Longispora fulva]|uniref:DUF3710 domain-containing protein n=1 Tax=Longispora fulva TaxID=619741 RepID=A0A8J7GKD0_9ACTN|nr:DUF3710 domain-containing protein [Longispora fulva]MBG6138020.1 hypothetical protein [Longispora fulva]GIG60273.1 hypothetical protein Lfu02_46450 [Longispora fulva]
MFGRRDKDAVEESTAAAEAVTPGTGPYDAANAPAEDGIQRLDLGSLLLPALPDLELRMQANDDGTIAAVIIASPDSALQLGVFAAPRTESIWDEVRADIAESVVGDGGKTEESEGEFGTELLARVPTPEGLAELRFIGVDGPKWFLRGLFQGKAVTDESAAEPLVEALRHLVVVRDREARPVREPLPLRLPKEFAEQAAQQQAAQEAQQTGGTERRPSPNPRTT